MMHGVRTFFTSKEAKEITVAHVAIFIACGVVYFLVGRYEAAIAFIALMFSEMIVFHTLWFYRKHKTEERTKLRNIGYAVGLEVVNLIFAFIVIALLTAFSIGVARYTGFPAIYTILILGFISLVLFFAEGVREMRKQGEE